MVVDYMTFCLYDLIDFESSELNKLICFQCKAIFQSGYNKHLGNDPNLDEDFEDLECLFMIN